MENVERETIGNIVSQDYRTAGVFKKFGLDFCCGGKRTIAEACEKKGVNIGEMTRELASLKQPGPEHHNFNDWSPAFLIDYIINNHHEFVRQKTAEIEIYARKVAKVHGGRHEELLDILREFLTLKNEMLDHLMKEEKMLFPYIKALAEADKKGAALERPHFGSAENPVAMMEMEHEEAGEAMARIQKLSNNFTPPGDACATYRVLFQSLEGFRDDLHKHIHLENNILFLKALELEKRVS